MAIMEEIAIMEERGGREGQQIGNYRLVRLIGHGGFADVYLGEHQYLKTPVAIKLLQAKVIRKDTRQDFLQEAQTIARLLHPHIVRVTDFGVQRKTPFLVMEYAPNGTLRQRHPMGTILPLTTLLPYVRQIAAALQYAHDAGVIHRDVKPENMLVGRNNEILLSDFGVAMSIQLSQSSFPPQVIIGTKAYMAPEQIQGHPVPATDQYALGAVVYEWLSGTSPFYTTSLQASQSNTTLRPYDANQSALPPSLSENAPNVTPAVEQVVMKALAHNPELRFQNVQAFAAALEDAVSKQPAQSAPVTKKISIQWEPLTPTMQVSSPSQGQSQTEKATQVNAFSPQRTEVAPSPPTWHTPATSANLKPKLPVRRRLQIAFMVGGILGLLGALIQMVLALWNISFLLEAGKQIAENKLAIPVAFAFLGLESLIILVGLLVSFISGMIAGKLANKRSVGFLTGIIVGATLYLITFFVSYLPQYPINTTVRNIGAGLVGGSLIIALVLLCLWSILSGFIGLLGTRLTTRP